MKEQERQQAVDPSAKGYSPDAYSEDEIDLVELVAVLWRQRWLMVGVVTVITALAVVYCLKATPQYLISAQLTPGITGYDAGNKPVSSWSVKDIEALFAGDAQQALLLALVPEGTSLPKISTASSKDSKIVTIKFLWPDPVEGKKILQDFLQSIVSNKNEQISHQITVSRGVIEQLIQKIGSDKEQITIDRARLKDSLLRIQQEFEVKKNDIEKEILVISKSLELIPTQKQRLENTISTIKNNLKLIEAEQKTIAANRVEILQTIKNINARIETIDRETKELMELRKSMATEKSDQFALLMYSNIVQQNIAYLTTLQQRVSDLNKEINQYDVMEAKNVDRVKSLQIQISEIEVDRDQGLAIEKEKLNQKLLSYKAELGKLEKETELTLLDVKVNKEQELKSKEARLEKELQTLTVNLEALAAVEVVQSPFSSINPEKPKKIKIVVFAFVLGVIVAMMASLMYAFWARNKAKMV